MIILASKSPRRKELLSNLVGDIIIKSNNADENCSLKLPSYFVKELAQRKVNGIGGFNDIVIGADTIVYMNRKIYGKPSSENDAFEMLKELNGKTHFVYTGVCVKFNDKNIVFYDKSKVIFNNLTDKEIWNYIKSGSPLDKAGAYGIQDSIVVKKHTGSYSNIVGLPMERLKIVLDELLEEKCLE